MARVVAAKNAKAKEPLSTERIELAALDLIERDGLQNFSTRRLAQELHCEAMSIYHYFPSKGHLMDALIDHVIGEMAPLADPALPWIERVRRLGFDVRRTFTRRPNLFVFVGTHRMNTPKALAWLNAAIGLFLESGLPHDDAVRLFRATSYFITGASLDETAGYARGPSTVEPVPDEVMAREYPAVVAAGPLFRTSQFDRTFAFGWELMLSAMEQHVARYAR